MSKKEVMDSQHRFTTAQKPKPQRKGKVTFLDGIDISNKKGEEVAQAVVFYYDKKGKLTASEADSCAKVQETVKGKIYEVKFATVGASVGRMLDFHGLYYNPGDESKYEKGLGRMRYEYRKVSESAFTNYLRFLETGSEKYLLAAEREASNAPV